MPPPLSCPHDIIQDDEETLRLALIHNPKLNIAVFKGERIGRELFWVALQPFLLSRGYNLRPRYHPDWIPSWRNYRGPRFNICAYEDALTITNGNLLDAVRLRDGVKVVLKRVRTSTEEIPIARYFSSPTLSLDPRNKSVPILDIIPLPSDDCHALIVMPLLLPFDSPPFRRVGEFAEAVHQFLEGLEFMHEHKVAHRDACYFNLMMDGAKIIPKGFHFFHPETHDGVSLDLEWRERGLVKPNQYYFIDFGLSTRYPTHVNIQDVKDTGILGQDRSVPEASITVPYNPFKVDVYQLGNSILQVIEEYDGLERLLPLAQAMTRKNPDDRPLPSEALKQLRRIKWWTLRRRVWPRDIDFLERFLIKFCGISL
ncbi:hypothetical protein Hypma_003904 [Hypsizygus marmoreus]|uniref:Protein kinase domain-containing protein n=1 Tax=Hypsizygus marmoreus TaxID=39966 RepID=A0A369K9I3_HYPMA|nr:hypothetical protein Hypma_003904 [Hypsizygus marmoreus]